MENSDLIQQYIASLDASVDSLSTEVTQLISKSFEDRLNLTSDPLEQITIANGYAYILTSLCFAYLKSQGVNTTSHPIMKDLDRVKSYMSRAKLASEGKDEVKVDTTAAKRFIHSVLGRGGNAPAISSENFKPKHTKFEDDQEVKQQKTENEEEEKEVDEKKIANDIRNKLKEKLKAKEKKSRQEGKVNKKSKK